MDSLKERLEKWKMEEWKKVCHDFEKEMGVHPAFIYEPSCEFVGKDGKLHKVDVEEMISMLEGEKA